jgi:hypothetical protein
MRNSESLWQSRNTTAEPAATTRMQRLFNVLLQPVWLPWHADHAECDRVARHDPIHIASFVAILEVDGKGVLIPVEENHLTRCAICAVVEKVYRYTPNAKTKCQIRYITLRREREWATDTLEIDSDQGTIDHALLLDFLETMEAGEMVHIKVA